MTAFSEGSATVLKSLTASSLAPLNDPRDRFLACRWRGVALTHLGYEHRRSVGVGFGWLGCGWSGVGFGWLGCGWSGVGFGWLGCGWSGVGFGWLGCGWSGVGFGWLGCGGVRAVLWWLQGPRLGLGFRVLGLGSRRGCPARLSSSGHRAVSLGSGRGPRYRDRRTGPAQPGRLRSSWRAVPRDACDGSDPADCPWRSPAQYRGHGMRAPNSDAIHRWPLHRGSPQAGVDSRAPRAASTGIIAPFR